jgi:hypothetical protein
MSEPDEFTDRIDSPPVKPLSDDGLEQLRLLLFAKPRGTIGLRPVVCLLMRLDAVQAELDQTRSLRILLRSLDALIDPAVHTPAKVRAYLAARGWKLMAQYPRCSEWHQPDLRKLPGQRESYAGAAVLVVDDPGPDYGRRVAEVLADLADLYAMGELQVLADIEAATP